MAKRICAAGGCELPVRRNVNGTGYCNKHAKRAARSGNPDIVQRIASYAGQECSVEGCAKQPRRNGLCPAHSEQMRTHGDPLVWVRASPGSGTTRKRDGYRVVTAAGHPLADHRWLVLEHRKVLYDKIGPGPHPCHWCGISLNWESGITATSIVADHLDGVRGNNDPANLVPSCNPCNAHRPAHGSLRSSIRRNTPPTRPPAHGARPWPNT